MKPVRGSVLGGGFSWQPQRWHAAWARGTATGKVLRAQGQVSAGEGTWLQRTGRGSALRDRERLRSRRWQPSERGKPSPSSEKTKCRDEAALQGDELPQEPVRPGKEPWASEGEAQMPAGPGQRPRSGAAGCTPLLPPPRGGEHGLKPAVASSHSLIHSSVSQSKFEGSDCGLPGSCHLISGNSDSLERASAVKT